MDGLSGAASAIAVIGFALGTTQTIYNAVSSIQNGPPAIRQMLSSLQSLLSLLRQLSQSRDSFYLAADLPKLAKDCAEDLKPFEEKLSKLSRPADHRMRKVWKHVKVVFGSKDLDKMATLIQQHVGALSLQVQIIEGNRGATHSTSLERIKALSEQQIALRISDSGILGEAVTATHDTVKGLDAKLETSNAGTRQVLEQLGDKVQDLSGWSAEQSETSNAILVLLKQLVSGKSQLPDAEASGTVSASNNRNAHNVEESTESLDEDEDGIRECLDRLCRLAEETDRTVYSEDAEKIVDDLQSLLDLLLKAGKHSGKDKKGKSRRESHEGATNDEALQNQRECKRMKGILSASQCISLNGRAHQPVSIQMERYKSTQTQYKFQFPVGALRVRTRRRRRISSRTRGILDDTSPDSAIELWDAHFAFSLNGPRMAQVAIAFQQQMLHHGSFLKKPILTVSALLPKDSKVFRLIEAGDLEGLIESLSLREARLTDRDTDGRCLLHYAMIFTQPNVCQYLVEHGADVDFIEPAEISINPHLIHALDAYPVTDCEVEVDRLNLVNQCRSVLLAAGADPTLDASAVGGFRPFITDSLLDGTLETLRLLLDHSGAFLATSDVIRSGLLLHDHLDGQSWTLETVTLLLNRSWSLEVPVHNLTGCLHLAASGSKFADLDALRDVFILLIEAGADIYERDKKGRTTSEIVCNPATKCPSLRSPGQVYCWFCVNSDLQLREIWSEALSACGYDAEIVISKSVRWRTPNTVNYLKDIKYPRYAENGMQELSDSSDDNMSSEEVYSSMDESGHSIAEKLDEASDIGDEASETASQSKDQYSSQNNAASATTQFEQSVMEGDIFADKSDCFIEELDDASDSGKEASETGYQSEFDHYFSQLNAASATTQFEQSVLEGDAQVWQS